MLISFCLIGLIAAGGWALTYIFKSDETALWRSAAGTVIGSAVFGVSLFVLGFAFGISATSAVLALLISSAPLLIFLRPEFRRQLQQDKAAAFARTGGFGTAQALRFGYYLFFFVLFIAFFERVMMVTPQGIFTGGSQNLGDLPYHLGAIYGFLEAGSYPPDNPSFAGAKFTYPFVADLMTAGFMRLGVELKDAMLVQNVLWAMSLLVIFERFTTRLVNSELAGKIAPVLLFLSGGAGFLVFFREANGLSDLWNLTKDHTVGNGFAWGNSLVSLFLTQRSLLLGMPLTIVVLNYLWAVFASPQIDAERDERPMAAITAGLIAGLLPLIHLHSLIVLFVVTAFLFAFRPQRWKTWIAFGLGVCITALPMLIWTMTGSATRTSEFIGVHLGWSAGDANVIWFWLKNTGIFFPMLAVGIYAVIKFRRPQNADEHAATPVSAAMLLQFYLPFALIFILCNIFKFAPWEWDNIKLLIYWFAVSLVFVAYGLAKAFRHGRLWAAAAVACIILLIFSGSLDVWRTVSKQVNMRIFDRDAIAIAESIKTATPRDSLFLNAPTYNSAVVLSGRPSLMRYTGHLFSHGIDAGPRERDVRTIYNGGPAAAELLQRYGIKYVLISPEERNTLQANEQFFAANYRQAMKAGQYTVYQISQ